MLTLSNTLELATQYESQEFQKVDSLLSYPLNPKLVGSNIVSEAVATTPVFVYFPLFWFYNWLANYFIGILHVRLKYYDIKPYSSFSPE